MRDYHIAEYRRRQDEETKRYRMEKAKLLSDWRKGGSSCFIRRNALVKLSDGRVGRVVRVEPHYETYRFGIRLRHRMYLSPIIRYYHADEIIDNFSR